MPPTNPEEASMPPMNGPPPPHGPPNGPPGPPPPGDYYRFPPPYYDPYYYDSYDWRAPYPPHGHPNGPPPPHGPPHGPPPPRYSPEYRGRYAYPPPGRSPRSMYGMGPPPGMGPRRGHRPSPISTNGNAGGGPATPAEKASPIVSRGPSPDGSKTAVSTDKSDAKDVESKSDASDGRSQAKEGDKSHAEADKENCPANKSPKNEEFMDKAVDNIIAAAEQIEKRDSPPNCPKKPEDAPATSTNNAATDASNNANTYAAAPTASPSDPNSSPPPPSFHRYSTSPVMHPPMTHSMHDMPGMPPPPNGMNMPPPGMPPPGPYNYDPYYDYRGPYDYYDQYGPPPHGPPHDYYDQYGPPPHGPPHGPPGRPPHPPHCTCHYCSPSKRRMPAYPPPYFGRDYSYSLSSPDEPPTKRRKRDNSKRMYNTYSNATKHKSNVRRLSPQEEEAEMERATKLAAEVENDPDLYRAVLLHMALEKESPKKPNPSFDVEEVLQVFSSEPSASMGASMGGSPNSLEGFGGSSPHGFGMAPPDRGLIGEGFYWKDYPILENVLRKSMDEYYEMSENCPQSKQQQQFNNRLVSKVYHTAIQQGYTFDPMAFMGGATPLTERKNKGKAKDPEHDFEPLPPGFNYKKLRDRIRCYYKTHVQNSKKRLTTMLKNPTKPKNREILLRVVAEVKREGYVGPLSGCWPETKTKKQKVGGSKVTPSVTFSSEDDDFGLGSFSTDSASPTEAGRILVESDQQQQAAASPFRRMEHAQILSSMRDQVSI